MPAAPLEGIAFDWGDTLMQLFPGSTGAMADWPEVASVEGAAAALSSLREHYRLFVATNAVDSSADQISAALKRVDLDLYFEKIYTYHQLSSRKPDPEFFHALARQTDIPPARMLMVGDTYKDDILGAKHAGWKAVWLNPQLAAAPALQPVQDADIKSLFALPEAVANLSLPDLQACLAMLIRAGASHNLLQHVQTVAAIAYQIAIWLKQKGIEVNPLLAQRGGMLHDIGKMKALQSESLKHHHEEIGAQILESSGQPDLAEITRRHGLYSLIDPHLKPETWEQKLVYFADKLVEGAHLVKIEERISALRQRYRLDEQKLMLSLPLLADLQNEISGAISKAPDEWYKQLKINLKER